MRGWPLHDIFQDVMLAVLILGAALLIANNHTAIDLVHEGDCKIAGLLVGSPVVRQPGLPRAAFRREVGKVRQLLIEDKRLGCFEHFGGVTTVQINRELRRLQQAARHPPPPGTSLPPATRGGGSATGPPSASPPGGGTTGGQVAPPASPPTRTVTTTTTTTTPAPAPPPRHGPCIVAVCVPDLTGPHGVLPSG